MGGDGEGGGGDGGGGGGGVSRVAIPGAQDPDVFRAAIIRLLLKARHATMTVPMTATL